MRPQMIFAMIATVVFALVLGASAFDRSPDPMHSECHCCMAHRTIKKKADTKTIPEQKECGCCKDSCPITKKDVSEKTRDMSCEKCECCKMKTTDNHAKVHGNVPKTDAKPHADPKSCDCPCCSPKATDKNKKDEVVTLALVNY